MRSDNKKPDYWKDTDTYFKKRFDELKNMLEYLTPEEIKKNNLGTIQKILLEETRTPSQEDMNEKKYDAMYPNISGEKSKLARLQAAYVKWDKWTDQGVIARRSVVDPVFDAINVIKDFDKAEPFTSKHSEKKFKSLQTKLDETKDLKKTESNQVAKSQSLPFGFSKIGGMFSGKPVQSQSDPSPSKIKKTDLKK